MKTDEVTKILENAVDSGDLNTVKKYIDVPCKNDLKNAVKEVSDKYENNTNIKQHNLGDIDFEYNDNIFELKAPYDDAHSVVSKAVTKQDNDGYQEYINFINNLEKKNKFQIIIYLLSHFWRYRNYRYSNKIITKWIPLIFKLKNNIKYVIVPYAGYYPQILKYCIRFEFYRDIKNEVCLDSHLQLKQRFPQSYKYKVDNEYFINKINEEGKILFIHENIII